MATTNARNRHTNNIVIGSGELYYAESGQTGERYLGDAVSATLNVASERTQIFSGSGPVPARLVDKINQLTHTMNIVLRDISHENAALFVAGEVHNITVQANAVTDEPHTVHKGRWHVLGMKSATPSGVGAVAAGSVSINAGTPGNAGSTISSAQYTVDAEHGRIYIHPDAADVSDNGTAVLIDYTPKAATRKQVRSTETPNLRGALRYVEDTDVGEGRHIYIPDALIVPSGDMALMSRDTEQQISLAVEVQQSADGSAGIIIDGGEV